MKTIYLTLSHLAVLFEIVKSEIARKGADFYGWKNPPEVKDGALVHTSGWGENSKTVEVSNQEALDIYKAKLDGAYGERFAITMALLAGLVRQGKKVAILQIQKEEGLPFNAEGWVVISIEGHPAFHVSPEDLPMVLVEKAGLITLVTEGSEEATIHGWKGTNKVQELSNLLDWML